MNVLILPFSGVVGLVVSEPSCALGAVLDDFLVNVFRNDVAQEFSGALGLVCRDRY